MLVGAQRGSMLLHRLLYLAAHVGVLPTAGRALDLTYAPGCGTFWLARRGLDVLLRDVSAVAIGQVRDLARRTDVIDRCWFDVFDLDPDLPTGPPVDLIPCHEFRDHSFYQAVVELLAPGGLLAIAAFSETHAA